MFKKYSEIIKTKKEITSDDSVQTIKKKKRRRKFSLNEGEKKMLEYHIQHVEFIESAVKDILKEAKEYFTTVQKTLTDVSFTEPIFHHVLDTSINLEGYIGEKQIELSLGTNKKDDISNHFVNNANKEPVILDSKGSSFLIPERSSFFMSDFTSVNSLKHLGKKFDAIVVDPPWENKSAKRKKGYLYLPEYDLKKIPMNDILAEDGLLIVWVTNKQKYINFVKEHLFPLWNLQLVSHWHWLKVSVKGELVFDLSSSHKKPYEPLLIGKKNSCKMNHITATIPMERIICSIPCNVHSRKPDLDEILKEFLPPDSKCLEMFARNLLPGWTSWGNEVIKYQNTEYFITTPDGKKNNDADLNEIKKQYSRIKKDIMARAKAKRLVVRLVSLAGTGHFYTTTRNKATPALSFLKHDPIVNKHVLYTEQKVKKGEKKSKAGGR